MLLDFRQRCVHSTRQLLSIHLQNHIYQVQKCDVVRGSDTRILKRRKGGLIGLHSPQRQASALCEPIRLCHALIVIRHQQSRSRLVDQCLLLWPF